MPFDLPTYTWCGKTYKTIRGLHTAMLKAYPGSALSFDRDTLYLRWRDGKTLQFSRSLPSNIIADVPSPAL